jgi:serine O-acetyltransferase
MSGADEHGTGQRHTPLGPVVDQLVGTRDAITALTRGDGRRRLLPSRDVLMETMNQLRAALFPGFFSDWDLSDESLHFYVGSTLDRVLHALQGQITRAMCMYAGHVGDDCPDCAALANDVTARFLERLPEVRRVLATDVEAGYEGDPAARDYAEVIFSYPGLRAITDHRLAHELYLLDVPLIPRIISEQAHSLTGVDIHPGATIGERFFMDHGTGVVIGETTVIGASVRVYQGVTLGAKSFPLDDQGKPIKGVARHPVVEDGVIIYSGATILGRVTIGEGSVIGGNVWLTRSVPPRAMVTQSNVRQEMFESGAGI